MILLLLPLFSLLLVTKTEIASSEKIGTEDGTPTIFDEFWEFRMVNAPEFATSVGDYRYDDRLDEMSLSSYKRRLDAAKIYLKRVEELRVKSPGDSDLKLLQGHLQQFIEGMKQQSYVFPMNNLEGPHLDFPRLLQWMKSETVDDFRKMLSRMRMFPQQIDESITLMQMGIQTGWTMHETSVNSLPGVFLKMADEAVETSTVFTQFLHKPKGIKEVVWNGLVAAAKGVVKAMIQPAYRRLGEFIRDVYMKHTRPHIGASSLPNGAEYYAACLKFHTTTSWSADRIHQVGKTEVSRIIGRMLKVKEQTGFKGSLKSFKDFLRSSPKFNYSTGQEIIDNFKTKGEHAHSLLHKFFSVLPKAPYVIVPVPAEIAPSMSGAYYLSPPADGSRPGTFYINTYKPETRKRYSATSTGLHEAEPGHHLQGTLAIENGSKITFRRFMEDRKYYEAPASYPKNTAYIEGWGLYAEYLGEAMGVYKDPYDMFGRLSDEMMRACRLVVDTGMHAKGWSKDDAVAYLEENTALSHRDIVSEVNRYITWPGQATGYKMGEIKIREVRGKAEEALGEKFDLREFNTMVASMGGVPLDFLENEVNQWVKKRQQ